MSAPLEVRVALGDRGYPIRIGRGLLGEPAHWRGALRGRQALIVTDDIVGAHYLDPIIGALDGLGGLDHASITIPAGEAHKTLDQVERVFDALAAMRANRDVTLIALGGGVIGDLAGFAAACWMRGVGFVQMPTTLLAMVDSSVGGKTGVNLPAGKNLVGAFHQPRCVIADTATLDTLPPREYRSGLAEVVKYGAIGDRAFFEWLEARTDALIAREPAVLAEAIAVSCRNKAAIVERDEREDGERALLNFGHTFGHALETEAGYGCLLHGEAVAIGMVMAARLSARIAGASVADAERLEALLEKLDLPTRLPAAIAPGRLLDPMRLDKKNLDGRLRLILWKRLGEARADFVDADRIAAFLSSPTG
ncbi:MAG TPA: 3-dehydroquinate synthase [Dokdonella sp.]|uniref:3-dehydroquinate synthase n=1 Tax=Dokdonella sp. TaxID=2291710 RepID=UPI002C75B7E2|nr:3-dehydroquinate synthase [Dokdonella sp.]HUD43196.1 3-dehydroquinate synthase [Dokdonella sp.]